MSRVEYIRRLVDAAPPLTEEQRAVIAAQLRPVIRKTDSLAAHAEILTGGVR